MDTIVTALIVLFAVALVIWRLVRFVRGLASPKPAGGACSAACASCPVAGSKGCDWPAHASPAAGRAEEGEHR